MGILEKIQERVEMLTRTAPGRGRRPGEPKISDFMADSQGIDETTTSTIKMLHKMDTVTFINSYEGTVANFEVKYIIKTKAQFLWQTISEKTEEKVENFSLNTGDSKTITLDEGVKARFGIGGDVSQNVDIFITLLNVDGWYPEGEEPAYVAPGEEVFFGEGSWYSPENIRRRFKGDRPKVMGNLGPAHYPGRASLLNLAGNIQEREKVIDLIKKGTVTNPIQAVMIRSTYAYDDAKKFKEELPLRPY